MKLFRRRKLEGIEAAESEGVAGERSIASVNRAVSLSSRASNLLALGLMGSLGVGLLAWYYTHTFAQRAQVRERAESATKNRAQGDMPLPPLPRIDPPHLLGPSPPAPQVTPSDANPAPPTAPVSASQTPETPPTGAPAPPTKTPAELRQERELSGPAFLGRDAPQRTAVPADETVAGVPTSLVVPQGVSPTSGTTAAPMDGGALASLLRPSVTEAARAEVLPTQRFLLPKGAFIDCTLETAIDSTLPGMTTCITATDTFSADGNVVLLERGTKLVGETRGEVQQGSSRVFVLWTEARTPTGVVVPLASPGTDELGRSGLAGEVNRHFWQRFGAAILISVINGAVQAAVQSASNNSTVVVTPSAAQDVMTEVLKGTINIPPTVTKQNGDRIQVFVARDLDFRSVYELRPIR
jgi:type IV secretion system protein VirB10